MAGLWFDQFEVGQRFTHEVRRTVTDMDNMLFSSLTYNPSATHIDHSYAANTEFGRPLMNSGLPYRPRGADAGTARMRLRSLRVVPADSERKFAKARACGADGLILDLEDAVARSRKAVAREFVAGFIASEGLVADCRRARRDGYTGRIAIHPDQVAAINAASSPTAEDLALARRLVAAFAAAPDADTIGLDGRMYDRPHLKAARRTLAAAEER